VTANHDSALAAVEVAGLEVAAAYDSGDPLRIDRAAAAYINADAAYDVVHLTPMADELAAMGPESVMTELSPCCGYPEAEAEAEA
jgi:hypothetical protein